MKINIKVQNFLSKHRSSILATIKSNTFNYTDTNLFDKLENLMQEMYDLGHADGWAEAWSEFNRLEEENGNL